MKRSVRVICCLGALLLSGCQVAAGIVVGALSGVGKGIGSSDGGRLRVMDVTDIGFEKQKPGLVDQDLCLGVCPTNRCWLLAGYDLPDTQRPAPAPTLSEHERFILCDR